MKHFDERRIVIDEFGYKKIVHFLEKNLKGLRLFFGFDIFSLEKFEILENPQLFFYFKSNSSTSSLVEHEKIGFKIETNAKNSKENPIFFLQVGKFYVFFSKQRIKCVDTIKVIA